MPDIANWRPQAADGRVIEHCPDRGAASSTRRQAILAPPGRLKMRLALGV
jgi:hypothetical protein